MFVVGKFFETRVLLLAFPFMVKVFSKHAFLDIEEATYHLEEVKIYVHFGIVV